MLMQIFFRLLHQLTNEAGSRSPLVGFFDVAEVSFVPVVNIDGYSQINAAWGRPDWSTISRRRKNLNLNSSCATDSVQSGVDLNRNYGYQFGADEEGSVGADPCDEIFRGASAFSEPETRAIRDHLAALGGEVSAAMNFHAFGNLWIWPYNYYLGDDNDSLLTPGQSRFFADFDRKIARFGIAGSGNAIRTIKYPANGEASDWMLGTYGVIALSPELGDPQEDSRTMYPTPQVANRVLRYSWQIIQEFLAMAPPDLRTIEFEAPSRTHLLGSLPPQSATHTIEVKFESFGILTVRDAQVKLRFFSKKFESSLRKVRLVTKSEVIELSFRKTNSEKKELELKPLVKIPKLETCSLLLDFDSPENFELEVILLKDGKRFATLKNFSENAFIDLLNQISRMNPLHLILLLCFVFIFIVCLLGASYVISRRSEYEKTSRILGTIQMSQIESAEESEDLELSFRSQH